MKKLNLFVSRSEREDLLRELILFGCVEISEPDELLEDSDFANTIAREAVDIEKWRSNYSTLARGLDVINQFAPVKTGMFAAKPEISGEDLLEGADFEKSLETAQTLDSLENKMRRLQAEELNERNTIESLTPWRNFTLPLNTDSTRSCTLILGAVASSISIETLQDEIWLAAEESEIFLVSSNKELHYLCVICLKDKQSIVNEVLRRYNFSLTSLRHLDGTARSYIDESSQRITQLSEERSAVLEQISEAAQQRDLLRLCYDYVGTRIARAEATQRLLATDYSLLMTGWFTAKSEPDLLVLLSKYTCAWDITDPDPDEYAKVPVKLNNNALTSPVSMVTEMYSLPAYGSIDPNPVMMPFFVLFYGLMMADMGYGLIMMIAGIIIKSKKPTGGTKTFFDLLFLCGVSTFIVGIMVGGFFGDAPAQISKLLGGSFELPYKPLFDPLNNTIEVLVGAFVLGGIHIIFGMGVAFYMQARDGKLLDAILDIGSWWVIFAGLIMGALGYTWNVALAGVAVVVLTGGRNSPNIFGKLIGGVGKLYDISAYFSDILSYSRVMALMLAGGVIANVFNEIGAMTGNIVAFFVVFLLGHSLNFGLNLLGCFVHDMRLQTLEFFGKFYVDGGKPFKPLDFKTKYNKIV
ncbi:MAG: V-type ATP synthase subunit I [Oscillospiraceae bacterium]|nr:V-type ATP synthase subunit I [Oscillospiraceae bacterium]